MHIYFREEQLISISVYGKNSKISTFTLHPIPPPPPNIPEETTFLMRFVKEKLFYPFEYFRDSLHNFSKFLADEARERS